ncbi:MAG: gamma-glutamylcyclotransferase family protein [Arenicellales bacterium]
MDELYYFAYGSNMSSRRLRQRVPSARPLDVGRLSGHTLAWHKKGGDGSGKCDIAPATPDDVVYGVLYEMSRAEKPSLDRVEGLGRSYGQKYVELWLLEQERRVTALTYYALVIDGTYLPYDWYRDHVLIGAREHGLPGDYVAMIENAPAFEDSDKAREMLERHVHRTE